MKKKLYFERYFYPTLCKKTVLQKKENQNLKLWKKLLKLWKTQISKRLQGMSEDFAC